MIKHGDQTGFDQRRWSNRVLSNRVIIQGDQTRLSNRVNKQGDQTGLSNRVIKKGLIKQGDQTGFDQTG